MNDDLSREVKRRAGEFFRSPDFDPHFRRLHHFSRIPLIASWLFMPFLLRGDASKGAWSKLTSGDVRSSGLRRRYARLGETGEVLFTYVLVCNASLKFQPGANAPALVIGNFNDGKDEDALLGLREKLADLTLGENIERRDRKVARLLRDLTYRFQRRRSLPVAWTGGIEITAFDLMILGDFLPAETLQIEAIPCLAEPGKRGLIAMIPSSLIRDVVAEHRKKSSLEPPPLPVPSAGGTASNARKHEEQMAEWLAHPNEYGIRPKSTRHKATFHVTLAGDEPTAIHLVEFVMPEGHAGRGFVNPPLTWSFLGDTSGMTDDELLTAYCGWAWLFPRLQSGGVATSFSSASEEARYLAKKRAEGFSDIKVISRYQIGTSELFEIEGTLSGKTAKAAGNTEMDLSIAAAGPRYQLPAIYFFLGKQVIRLKT